MFKGAKNSMSNVVESPEFAGSSSCERLGCVYRIEYCTHRRRLATQGASFTATFPL